MEPGGPEAYPNKEWDVADDGGDVLGKMDEENSWRERNAGCIRNYYLVWPNISQISETYDPDRQIW